MTLLDRLKPQYKDLIDQKIDKFPTFILEIYDHLEDEEYIYNLKYGVWLDIKSFTNADNPYDVFKESN